MKKKILIAAGIAAAGAGVTMAVKKKKEESDVIFKRIYPEKGNNEAVHKAINSLKDKLEDFQINVLCASDVPLEYLKKTAENLKGEFVCTEENFRRTMERSQSKLSSELIKAQMNINEKREEVANTVAAELYKNQKEKDAAYAKALAEDAEALNIYALNLMDEAMAVSVEAEMLAKEYEANYGEALYDAADKIISELKEKEDEA